MKRSAILRPAAGWMGRLVVPAVLLALGLCWAPFALSRHTSVPTVDPSQPASLQEEPDEEEEHGGDLVFHVASRIQKYSVIYSHEAHLNAGLECADCHDSIFKKEMEGNHFKMKDINRGKACGVCHQTEPPEGVLGSFAPKNNCSRCHTVRVRKPEKK